MSVGLALDEVQEKAMRLAQRIEAPTHWLPTFGTSDENGRPSIEARGGGLAYVVRERGQVFEDWWASTEDELMYWIFRSVTHQMATSWELHHRVEGQDTRKGWIPKQLELLRSLSPAWEAQLRRERASILSELGLT
jgi:hypothetical protein